MNGFNNVINRLSHSAIVVLRGTGGKEIEWNTSIMGESFSSSIECNVNNSGQARGSFSRCFPASIACYSSPRPDEIPRVTVHFPPCVSLEKSREKWRKGDSSVACYSSLCSDALLDVWPTSLLIMARIIVFQILRDIVVLQILRDIVVFQILR